MKSKLSASIMCADALHLGRDLDALGAAGVDYLHCDVMDGHFVPNLMLSTATIAAVKAYSPLPLDIHMMVDDPGERLAWIPFGPGDVVSIHYESTRHVQRALRLIADRGATPALALNPATPLCAAEDVLADIGMLLLMTVNPGYAGQALVPQTLDKVRRARAWLDGAGYGAMPIEVDGNCSFANLPAMKEAGASVFVVGSSSLFDPALGIARGTERARACLKQNAPGGDIE